MSLDGNGAVDALWREVEEELETVDAFGAGRGSSALRYRSLHYGSSLERMVRRLPAYTVESSTGEALQPLRRLKVEGGETWTLALLESWALVGEVLGFYQERLANEGFLATASQEISVRELLRMVGYRPFPGVAGTALSAFLVSGAQGMPEVVEVPRGARIQGVPLDGQLPQIFQSDLALGARAEWNRMAAHVPTVEVAPPLEGASRTIDLAGYETSLKPGDPLLVLVDPVAAGGSPEDGSPPRLRRVDKAKRRQGKALRLAPGGAGVPARRTLRGYDTPATEVTLTSAVDPSASGELRLRAAYRFAAAAHLFGYDAPVWSKVPDAIRRRYAPIEGGVQLSADDGATWGPSDDGLPEVEVYCLLATGPRLFAGTARGLYRRSDDAPADPSSGSSSADGSTDGPSTGWRLLTGGLGRVAITAIAGWPGERSGRHLWVADSRGQVYQSSDGGDSFAPVQGRATAQLAGVWPLLRTSASRVAKSLRFSAEPPARPSLPAGPVHCLAVLADDDQPRIFAGTEKGVFRFESPAGGWRGRSAGLPGADPTTGQAAMAVRALLVEERGGGLLLGGDKGLFRSTDGGRRWHDASRGLPPDVTVSALAGSGDRRRRSATYFAGTSVGVYRSEHPGRGWVSASLGLLDPAPDAAGPPSVTALACRLDPVDLGHHVFAGTPAGLWRSTDGGSSWGAVDSLTPAESIADVVVDPLGRVLVAMPFAGFAARQWPGFHLAPGAIDLDRVYPHVVAGGWVVLTQPAEVGGVREAIFVIRAVTTVERSDFELTARVTRLEVDDDGTLVTFDLRATRVDLSSVALEPWRRPLPDLRPVTGSSLRVAPDLAAVPDGERRMIVTGKRARVRPRRGGWGAVDPAATPRLPDAAESLQALAWRRLAGGGDAVEAVDRFGRRLSLLADALEWLPADDDDATVGQAVTVVGGVSQPNPPTAPRRPPSAVSAPAPSAPATSSAAGSSSFQTDPASAAGAVAGPVRSPRPASRLVGPSQGPAGEVAADAEAASAGEGVGYTTLRLDDAIEPLLDPSTVALWGNVAPSSQGETVSEVLGSGDAARALQRFALTRSLTYLPAATEDGFRSTLEVQVAGALWRQVPHLAEVDGTAHAYMVRPDLAGRETVIFGDGENGARLPTGRDNVVATYRSGMWPKALAPKQLSILQTRPLGLRHADNPLATEPGAPAEDKAAGRSRMPAWLRPLGRAVTLRDFQDLVGQNTAIARNLVAPLVLAGRRLIQMTIAGQGGEWLDPRGEVFRQLSDALRAQRAPGPPLRLQNYEPVRWLVGLRLALAPSAARARVVAQVRALFDRRFAFEQAEFGQSLYVGQMVDTALEVDGVEAAEALRFGTVGDGWLIDGSRRRSVAADPAGAAPQAFEPAPSGRLRARLARVDAASGAPRPAQLLRLATVELETRR